MSENVGYDFQKTAESLKRLGKEFVENTVWPEETKARILTALNNRVDELSREAEQKQGEKISIEREIIYDDSPSAEFYERTTCEVYGHIWMWVAAGENYRCSRCNTWQW